MARTLTGERLEKELLRLEAMKAYEKENKDCALICGIDEAGRGPLAGPGAAGAGIPPRDCTIPARIDEINILQATYEAMRAAIGGLSQMPDLLLNDAVTIPGMEIPQIPIVKGDAKSVSIAAASILAKVTRDHLMAEYDKLYPGYGFAKHKGYGTAAHIAALRELGPSPIHRRTFIKNFV